MRLYEVCRKATPEDLEGVQARFVEIIDCFGNVGDRFSVSGVVKMRAEAKPATCSPQSFYAYHAKAAYIAIKI